VLAVGGAILLPSAVWLDRAGAIVVCVFILWASVGILKPALAELVDEAAPESVQRELADLALRVEGVRSAHALRTRTLGASLAVDLHVEVDPELTVARGYEIACACGLNSSGTGRTWPTSWSRSNRSSGCDILLGTETQLTGFGMAITFTHAIENNLLLVSTSGFDGSVEDVAKYGMGVLGLCLESGCLGILCDERSLEYRVGILICTSSPSTPPRSFRARWPWPSYRTPPASRTRCSTRTSP
jgi:hypothetical protein